MNVINIDTRVKDHWNQMEEQVAAIQTEIQELQQIVSANQARSLISDNVVDDLHHMINDLARTKASMEESLVNRRFYDMEYAQLLEQYQTLLTQPKRVSFMGKREQESADSQQFTTKYLELLKKYDLLRLEHCGVVTPPSTQATTPKCCSGCGSHNVLLDSQSNTEICEDCGKDEEKTGKLINFRDISRVNLSNKYLYERSAHFKDCIAQYQGKQNVVIAEQVYQDIRQKLWSNGLVNLKSPTSGRVLTTDDPPDKKYARVTKEHIAIFLKETGHTKNYEDTVLIYKNITHKKVDDISHLENKLMEDFEAISKEYDRIFKFTCKVDRKSFINTQYILYQLLRKHRYPCEQKDFNIVKTLDRRVFHDQIMGQIYLNLGWSFQPLF